MESSNPIRFADYFFRTGISPTVDLHSGRLQEDNSISTSNEALHLGVETPRGHGGTHPLKFRYEPETLYRYPKKDYSETDTYPLFTPLVCRFLISSVIQAMFGFEIVKLAAHPINTIPLFNFILIRLLPNRMGPGITGFV